MLLGTGLVEGKTARDVRLPSFHIRPDGLLLDADRRKELMGDAAAQEEGAAPRSGGTHRTAKLRDLYTPPAARGQGVGRTLRRGVKARARGARSLPWCVKPQATRAGERTGDTAGAELHEGDRFIEVKVEAAGAPASPGARS